MAAGLREPPYAADVRAKGWRLETDYERAEQSDAMALAPPEVRPWLNWFQYKAWQQTPCGSLPNDDALIIAKVGIPPKLFAKWRRVLMLGWWPATDGRLYHDDVVARVLDMLERKKGERERKARWREEKANKTRDPGQFPGKAVQVVPRDTQGTTAGQTPDRRGSPAGVTAPEPEPGTGSVNPPTPRGHRGGAEEDPEGFAEFWAAYPKHTGRPNAVREFREIAPSRELRDRMIRAIRWQRDNDPQWKREATRFVPAPARWLSDGEWLNVPDEASGAEWWRTEAGMKRKALEHGLDPWPGTPQWHVWIPGFKKQVEQIEMGRRHDMH